MGDIRFDVELDEHGGEPNDRVRPSSRVRSFDQVEMYVKWVIFLLAYGK